MLNFALKIKKPGRVIFSMRETAVVLLGVLYGFTVLRPLGVHCLQTKRELNSLARRISLIHQWRAAGKGVSGPAQTIPQPRSDLAEALLKLQALGQETGLAILSIQPGAVEKNQAAPSYRTTLVQIEARGTEASLAAFLSKIKTCGFLCQISRLRIAADRSGKETVAVQAALEIIDVLDVPDEAPYAIRPQKDDETAFLARQARMLFKSPKTDVGKIVVGAGVEPAQALKDLILVGIIEDSGRRAVVEDRASAKTHFVSEGDVLADLVIKEISEGAVVLESAGAAYRLDL